MAMQTQLPPCTPGTSSPAQHIKEEDEDDVDDDISLLGVSTNGETTAVSAAGGATPTAGDSSVVSSALARKESYKMQRKNYRYEKKRVAKELLSTLKDPTVIVLADWLKVRGTLKSWTKLWCILKPGLVLLYKSPKAKSSYWVGTIHLSTCKLIERPSKKDGFCFKLFHPLDQSIWAPKGPEGETIPAVVQPLPTSHLIFRAPSQAAGKCWMDALELAVKCSSLLMRSMSQKSADSSVLGGILNLSHAHDVSTASDLHWNESDCEKHFKDHDLSDSPVEEHHHLHPRACQRSHVSPVSSLCPSPTPFFQKISHAFAVLERQSPIPPFQMTSRLKCPRIDLDDASHTDENDVTDGKGDQDPDSSLRSQRVALVTESESEEETGETVRTLQQTIANAVVETNYQEQDEEEFGSAGEQTEEIADDNRSLIWYLVKQLRPGMDLSRVVLPTFILEPRSFLDKLSDYHYHADILSKAVQEDDPFTRMKTVVQWYLSGFYKKPKGLKKPYNPILGEVFRCCWKHPSGSRTFYIAEQVSHHPPVSAFYVTNRQEGFTLSASILAKSKYYGNSLSALLEGSARLTLLPRGEDYLLNMPYAHCKGILYGALTMELGGEVSIECEKTGYRADLEFKLKPLLGGKSELTNYVSGKLRLGKETLATLSGHWDGAIYIQDKRTGEEHVLWNSTPETRARRLKRMVVPQTEQDDFESERLWQHVTQAIRHDNQEAATEEKTLLEEAQRTAAKERKLQGLTWTPRCFEQDIITGCWTYRHADMRPWDPRNDLHQYEANFLIANKTMHRTPMIRAASIVSVEHSERGGKGGEGGAREFRARLLGRAPGRASKAININGMVNKSKVKQGSASSSADGEAPHSEVSDQEIARKQDKSDKVSVLSIVRQLEATQKETQEKLGRIHHLLETVAMNCRQQETRINVQDMVLAIVCMSLFQFLSYWLFSSRR